MQKIRLKKIYILVVFLMIWVYFSLNSKYFNLPSSHLLRWFFPAVLMFFSAWETDWKIPVPPVILIFFSIAVLPSIFLSNYRALALTKYLSWIFILYGSYMFFFSLKDREYLKRYFKILAIILIIYQILNFSFVAAGINYDTGRALGITTNSNTLGVYATLAYWAVFYMMKEAKRKLTKGIWCLVLVTAILTSVASGSRTAFVVLILNILLTIIWKFRKSPFLIVYIGICVGGAYFVLSGRMVSLNIIALDRLLEEGGTSRDQLWDAAISVWEQHQMFGVGYTVSNMYNPVEPKMAFHNSYISILVECGLWGAIILGSGVLGWFKMIIRGIRLGRHENVNIELVVALLMAFNLMVAAWSESFMFAVGSTEGFTFWFLVAWITAYIKLKNKE